MSFKQLLFILLLSIFYFSNINAQSITVSGTGTGADGTYTYQTNWNGKNLYAKGSYAIQWRGSSWSIGGMTDVCRHSSDTPKPPSKGWARLDGSTSFPSVRLTGDVTSFNNAPEAQNRSVTIEENASKTFSTVEFNYYDYDGDTFSGLMITTLEGKGTLKYNGLDVTQNQYCADVSLLNYTPAIDESGSPYTSFGFKVYDGTDYSSSSYTMTINVNEAMPVELTSFSAVQNENEVKLLWNTATEVNNYGFEILRSAQNDNWENVGFVKGAGNSNTTKSYSFKDKPGESGTYSYRLKQIDVDGSFKYSQEVEVKVNNLPAEFALQQNYPNPFNPATTIKYALPSEQNVSLKIYNMLGQEVATLVNKQQLAGNYEVKFDASELASGIYLYKLTAGSFTQTMKMNLLK